MMTAKTSPAVGKFYLAILDDALQDFRSASGPFASAADAAADEAALMAARPEVWTFAAPDELATPGDFFVCSLTTPDGLNCVLGPYASRGEADTAAKYCLDGGGVFEAEDDWFIAIARFVKQEGIGAAQMAVLERLP